MTPERVPVVTGNKAKSIKTALVEWAICGCVLYLIVNPGKIEAAQETLHRWRTGFAHRASIMRAQAAIRSLPETRER